MSLNKAIENGKEYRKQYKGKDWCKLIDPSCKNHGSCPWCQANRTYNTKRREQKADYIDYDSLMKLL